MFAAVADAMIHPVQTAYTNLASGGVAPTRLRVRVVCINPRYQMRSARDILANGTTTSGLALEVNKIHPTSAYDLRLLSN